MTETQIMITIRQDGEIKAEMRAGSEEICQTAAGGAEGALLTEQEAEKYAIVSDLADVCEHLTESEVIKIRMIIGKAQARRERGMEA